MLKTSPILSSSASSSPTTFRYAPSAHPDSKTPIPRRPNSRPTSSSNTVAVSKSPAIIKSPASLRSQHPHATMSTGNPPPEPRSQPIPPRPPPSSRSPPMAKISTATASVSDHIAESPNKRRCSPSQSIESETTADPAASSAESSMKRPRPEEQPPKALPQRYELCGVQDIVELIAYMLAELITTNDALRIPGNGGLTRFHSRTAPGISVRDYLHRLARHATLTPPLLLAMVYYIDRLCAMYQDFTINTLTVHRFLITAATVAAKGLSDSFWNNTTYARVGGVKVNELKLLELEFLHRVDWKIVPNPEVLVAYYKGLVDRTPGYVLEPGDEDDEDSELDEVVD